jgi:undecaprenyl phosphate-alpha-L-ara4N flippase subunit ArnE
VRTVLYFVGLITFVVIANLLMKTGAVMGRESGGSMLAQLLNWRIIMGMACFGAGALCYVLVLRTLPLNVAQAFAAAQFVAVILASAFVLSEPIGPLQWVGIGLITSGIAILGWSQG